MGHGTTGLITFSSLFVGKVFSTQLPATLTYAAINFQFPLRREGLLNGTLARKLRAKKTFSSLFVGKVFSTALCTGVGPPIMSFQFPLRREGLLNGLGIDFEMREILLFQFPLRREGLLNYGQ